MVGKLLVGKLLVGATIRCAVNCLFIAGLGTLMLVNPELLRGFAGQIQTASAAIRGVDVGHLVSTAADGLPGSTTQWAARLVGEHIATVEGKIAKNVADMGSAVHGAGDRYEVEDDVLAGKLKGLF
jgi:hypothetical protein